MAETLTDERVAAALRVFVRGCGAMLPRLREGDEPVDLETATDRKVARVRQVRFPGSDTWSRMGVEERSAWWVSRVGRLTALAASVTGLAGALGDRLPLQDVLGASGQGLLLCAIAAEHGVTDRTTRVQLLATVLFNRNLTAEVAAGPGDDAADEAEVAALTGIEPPALPALPITSASPTAPDSPTASASPTASSPPSNPTQALGKRQRFGLTTAAKWLWRQGRLLYAISSELEKRPHGRFYHRALGKLPVLGMLGDYLGERSALKRAAKAADRWLHRR